MGETGKVLGLVWDGHWTRVKDYASDGVEDVWFTSMIDEKKSPPSEDGG